MKPEYRIISRSADTDRSEPGEYPPYYSWVKRVNSPEHPQWSEDEYIADSHKRTIGVFDGVGGNFGAREASMQMRTAMHSKLRRPVSVVDAQNTLRRGLIQGWEDMRTDSGGNPIYENMATTATVAQIVEGIDRRVVFAHYGDSRLYVFNDEKGLIKLTEDDRELKKLKQEGHISQEAYERWNRQLDTVYSPHELDDAAHIYWIKRNKLTNMISAKDDQSPDPQFGEYVIRPDDRLLIATTDGVHDNLTLPELNLLARSTSPDHLAKRIAAAALYRSEDHVPRAKTDDITAVVMNIRDTVRY